VAGEPVSKTAVEHDVDDEIDSCVEGQHRVRYLANRLDQLENSTKITYGRPNF